MLGTFLLIGSLGTGDESAEDEPLTISSKLMALGKLLELSNMLEPLLLLKNDESSEEPLEIPIKLLLFDEFLLPNALELPEKPLPIPIEIPCDELLTELLNSPVSFTESGSKDCESRGEAL